MPKKKSNVFLSSAYNLYGLSGCKQCGFMESEQLNKILASLKNIDIPESSCIRSLYTHFERTVSIDKTEKASTEENLIISVWPTAKKCEIKNYKQCTACIANGNCMDEFVIDNIGKKLFADKYQGR